MLSIYFNLFQFLKIKQILINCVFFSLIFSAAFFNGQVEQPSRGFLGIITYSDVRVLVAINERGVYIIDPFECVSTY